MNFILLGKPGAGKGSISELLVKDGFTHLSTGDIFRAEIKDETELGKLASSYISKGELVPDEVTNRIVAHAVSKDPNKSYLFDGYPRTVNQAEALKENLKELGLVIDGAIYLDCPDELVIHRLSHRMVCKSCGQIYSTLTLMPKVNGVCDKCGGMVYTRDDDKEESVRNRLNVYEEKTKPLIDYYNDLNLLKSFNSDVNLNELYKVVKSYIDEINSHSSLNL